MKILIVDDQPLNLKLLRIRLEAEGEEVLEASDGREALNLLARGAQVDAIVSDIVMPNMDGYRLCYELRRQKAWEHIPFVFYSNRYSSSGDEQLAKEMGGDAFIPKPAGSDQVMRVLKEIVQRPRDAHASTAPTPPGLDVMRHYSELLVSKLEEQLAFSTAALREKEALLREVHHRVKNNLQVISSLLRLEAARVEPQIAHALDEMRGRVQSMATLHDMLCRTGTLAATDLAAYLRKVATQMYQMVSLAPGAVALQTDLETVEVNMDVAMPCGLIATELISNSLKHGFPDGRRGHVWIQLRRPVDGEDAVLTVRDDGVGLPENFDPARRTLGVQLVRDLSEQLRGRLTVERLSPGVSFRISFPV